MTITKTTWSIEDPYVAGLVIENASTQFYNSLNASGEVIAYGCALVTTPVYDEVALPTATGQTFAGVTVFRRISENAIDVNGDYGYADKIRFDRLIKGIIVVEIETDIAIGDPVFFRHTDNGGLTGNKFRNDADTANADEITVGARWYKGGLAADGYALLEINLP